MAPVRIYYATPWELRWRPWAADFTPDDAGYPPFPFAYVINPYQREPFLEWTTDDWDPALRFWTLPHDPQLTEWLRAVDPSAPSVLAAQEFGRQPDRWRFEQAELVNRNWADKAAHLAWRPIDTSASERERAWGVIRAELEELKMLMEDDRERYLAEAEAQADGLADYIIAFIGASSARHPWTIELISAGLAIGNIAYMSYKAMFKRVRPSTLCPGLVVPFGPPAHPSFPSGHSFLGHLIALLLLEIPGLSQRYGVFDDPGQATNGQMGRVPKWSDLAKVDPIPSPLLWLAQRLAKNRERIGCHYASDSTFSRYLAAGMWDAMFPRDDGNDRRGGVIDCPTLKSILVRATAEWPTNWAFEEAAET